MNRLAALLVFLAVPASAANPFQCVDPDILDAFLGHWSQGQSTFSTKLPPDFPPLPLPEGFALVGSQVSNRHMTVAFKSNKPAATALASTLAAMAEDDWKSLDRNVGMISGGFQMPSTPLVRMLCRESDPRGMSVMARDFSDHSLVSLSIYAQQSKQTCDDAKSLASMRRPTGLMEIMPKLSLPADTQSTNMGAGGSGDEMSSRVLAHTSRSREELMRYLGEQIRSQDWAPDSGWTGSVSSGSVWSFSSEKHGEVVGVLRITQASNEIFNIRFSVSPVITDQNMFRLGSFTSSSN